MESDLTALHTALLAEWNRGDAAAMAQLFAPKGSLIGFDGSIANGPEEILAHADAIFRNPPAPRFYARVREVRVLAEDVGLLRAVGMILSGPSAEKPEVNAIQTLIARRVGGMWKIELFQIAPAGGHGQADDAAKLTDDLQALA